MAANGEIHTGSPLTDAPGTARRKVRKGTRSCWQCKRRKVRCIYDDVASAETVCLGCKQRGTACISQEFADDEGSRLGKRRRRREDCLNRLQTLVEQLANEVSTSNKPPEAELSSNDLSTHERTPKGSSTLLLGPESLVDLGQCEDYQETPGNKQPSLDLFDIQDIPQGFQTQSHHHGHARVEEKYAGVPQHFRATLPLLEDANIICQRGGNVSGYFHQILVQTYSHLETNGLQSPEEWADLLNPTTHPILVARRMLILAIFLQNLCPNYGEAHDETRSSTSKTSIMIQFSETALSLIPTNDDLIETIEGLECIMLEGIFRANSGRLRSALVAFRRSIVVAQLMGIHRRDHVSVKFIDTDTNVNPHGMWFRILYLERMMCLLLGMPQGSQDRSIASEKVLIAEPHPMERLERQHCDIAFRILSRNENDPDFHDISATQEIDIKLRDAANGMAPRWWLMPDLKAITDNVDMFWAMLRLSDQLFHHFLLLQLHLPYLLQESSDPPHTYSKITCMNSCRELLMRFITFRSINKVVSCCRAADYFAATAAMALLLYHINSHRMPTAHNFLVHQRLTDRAMTEQALDSMTEATRSCEDMLSKRGADILRQLLDIESQAARGTGFTIHYSNSSKGNSVAGGKDMLQLRIPCFGNITIARESPFPSRSTSFGACETLRDNTTKPGIPQRHSFGQIPQNSQRPSATYVGQQGSPSGVLSSVLLHALPEGHEQPMAISESFSAVVDEYYLGQTDSIINTNASPDDWALHGADSAVLHDLIGHPADLTG